MAVTHTKVSQKPDGADTALILPSDWNASHTIENDTISYAQLQNVSATDKVLGRSTAGAGDVEEIACTTAARAFLDDLDEQAQRNTLVLGTANDVQFNTLGLGTAPEVGISLNALVTTGSLTFKMRTSTTTGYAGTNMYSAAGALAASFTYGNSGVGSLANKFFLGARIANEPMLFVNGAGATERMRLAGDGTFGVNVTVPSGQFHAKAAAAGTIAQVVQGFTSQTANLTEWQDSAGTVRAAVKPRGALLLTPDADVTDTIRINNAAGSAAVQLGTYPGVATYGGFWGGNVTPSTTNFVLIGNGTTQTILNVPTAGTGGFQVNGATIATWAAAGLKILGLNIRGFTSSTAAASTTEYPTDKDCGIHKNTTSGAVVLAYNDAGAIKTAALL